jgi:hypothetical protein
MTTQIKFNAIVTQMGNKKTVYGSVVDDSGNPIANSNVIITIPIATLDLASIVVGQVYTLTLT